MTDNRRLEDHWHLDKKVPIALIVAIGAQTIAGVWWAASITGDVKHNTNNISLVRNLNERVIRLEVHLQNQTSILSEIRDELKK